MTYIYRNCNGSQKNVHTAFVGNTLKVFQAEHIHFFFSLLDDGLRWWPITYKANLKISKVMNPKMVGILDIWLFQLSHLISIKVMKLMIKN